MTKDIFVVTFRQGRQQPFHFAMFIPSENDTLVGTLVHVRGQSLAPWQLEFRHRYNLTTTRREYRLHPIGGLRDGAAIEWGDGKVEVSSQPAEGDTVEQLAASVPVPPERELFVAEDVRDPQRNVAGRGADNNTTAGNGSGRGQELP